MLLLIVGLVVFLGLHLVPAVRPVRDAFAARWGDQRYKGLFSLASGVGLVLVVWGYHIAPAQPRLFAPVPAAIVAAPWIITVAFVLFAASHMRGHLRRSLQHPMVIGVILWAAVHLLANGDRRGTVLFGAFLAWALVDLVASLRRGPIAPYVASWRYDVMAAVGGIIVAVIVMALHRVLFGAAPVPFSL